MALTMEWSASSSDQWDSTESTATLKKYDARYGMLRISDAYAGKEVRLDPAELRELATMATALANELSAPE